MTRSGSAPGVEVTRSLLGYPTRQQLSDAAKSASQADFLTKASVLQPASLGRARKKEQFHSGRRVCT
jgi:hypothetical protein